MGRGVFTEFWKSQKIYHWFFGLLVLLLLFRCLVSLSKVSYLNGEKDLEEEAKEEFSKYIPIINISMDFISNSQHSTRPDCPIELWNIIRTNTIPNSEIHKKLAPNFSHSEYLYHTTPSVLAAFVYKDQITVTLTSENQYNKTVYCRYFDCQRREIPDQFYSVIFPQSTVFCARRPGAKYISIARNFTDTPEFPVPIIPRLEKEPPHYFTVCMATLYGDEPKFLQIVDFIEYYKLQGATFFHIYLRNVTDYDRVLLDDYVRTGDIEIIKMHDHHWRDDFMWHNSQINDCHHRNKYYSKWTALVDIDERIEIKNEAHKTILSYLNSIHNSSIVNLHFQVQWVIKQNNTPARYKSDEQVRHTSSVNPAVQFQLTREMIFLKYQNVSQVGDIWDQPKCIIRPEKVVAMTIHVPTAVYSGERFTFIPPSVGVVRHYRNVEQRVFAGALKRMMSHGPFTIQPIPKWLSEELTKRILERIKSVYNVVDVPCRKKQSIYRMHGIDAPCWLEKRKSKIKSNHGHGHGGRPRPPRPLPRPRPPREKTNCPAAWMLWRRPQGNWGAKVFVAHINHPQAEAQCNAQGAKLTGFQTGEERMKIVGEGLKLLLLNGWQHGNIWLGAKSKPACPHAGLCAPKDAFYWTDGQTTGTDGFGWAVGQPVGLFNAGVGRQACAHQYVFASGTTYPGWRYIHGQLDDQWCSDLVSFSANKMYACGKLST
ncbi:Protein CBG11356 [Caenorhabditis briggsae]|uniref:Protein CBG11356 n=2 Tax=Caenorhabditis briggsae TaxID=6238 RepID=A8XD74_CAEBR|nr:Protein CBG11356 [Caenorhabditis briggsae]CAP30593.2 Protein CBG11356 [Caenorhabditis briggsae]